MLWVIAVRNLKSARKIIHLFADVMVRLTAMNALRMQKALAPIMQESANETRYDFIRVSHARRLL